MSTADELTLACRRLNCWNSDVRNASSVFVYCPSVNLQVSYVYCCLKIVSGLPFVPFGLVAEQEMGRWVMGQMGHENQMGVDPWPISF